MISVYPIIFLFICHFIGDFLFQTDRMAQGKSKSNKWLTIHAAIYSLVFITFGLKFAVTTFLWHWLTDYTTSRIASSFWFIDILGELDGRFVGRFNENRHNFFVTIGFDQLIHQVTLVLTYIWLN